MLAKRIYALSLLCLLFLVSVDLVEAQNRRRSNTNRRRSTATRTSTDKESDAASSSMALTDARQRVADQVKNLTRFIYLFGRISNGIETTAETALQDKTGASRAQATEVVRRNKQALIENLRNVRGGLIDLESRFRTTTQLQRFSPQMTGLSDRINEAETQVTNGQLDQAGRSVIDVISRLTDALLIMR